MVRIGVDIGGTKILGVAADEHGTVLSRVSTDTFLDKGSDAVMTSLLDLIRQLLICRDVEAIGIGSAGRIDVKKGIVHYATPNVPGWSGVQLLERVEEAFGVPVFVDNDVKAAAAGEALFGAGKDFRSFMMLTLGTGLGGAVVENGKLMRGSHFSAGEVGHMILYPGGHPCNCGQNGCLEQYVSGTALVNTYNRSDSSVVCRDGEHFFQLVKDGDDVALDTLERFVDDLAVALVTLTHVVDPEAFVVGGGLLETSEFWWERLCERYEEMANPAVLPLRLVPARLGSEAGAVGAAWLK
ncbi:ROK family protein [Salimicrobium halophilum]|uniref:Glucokinase n=1 Tax=Salimicrobium halophilum TaxID=86666 RepID=A0A1G8SAF9_9BACI|nr:ROK family protein [Salimicrobium halophilum]SDJ25650.1 glucokinase [Salimicrobium halophilum]